jgi:hypothetical protein
VSLQCCFSVSTILYTTVIKTMLIRCFYSEKSFCILKLDYNETLTLKSLKGWIRIPNGNLDFCRRELDSGIFVKVHLKILEQQRTWTYKQNQHLNHINHLIFHTIPRSSFQSPTFQYSPDKFKGSFYQDSDMAKIQRRSTDTFLTIHIFLSKVPIIHPMLTYILKKHNFFHPVFI